MEDDKSKGNGESGSTDKPSGAKGIVRNRNSSSEDENLGSTDESYVQKRSKVNNSMDSPNAGFMFPGYSASPPKFVSLEEIMKAANGVSNMALAHEIAVDKNFKLAKREEKEKSLVSQVEQIVHKAFWDVLEEQLKMTPPIYTQAYNLMVHVKKDLMALLLPQHSRLKLQIEEILDMDIIKQQTENGVMDFHFYSDYVISVMSKLCAPVRDENVRNVMKVKDVVPLFREIVKLLELLKIDMANFTIQQIRPHIQQHSVEYEKTKFKEFLDVKPDGLEITTEWLSSVYDEFKEKEITDNKHHSKLVTHAFMKLLKWNPDKLCPETVTLDMKRYYNCGDSLLHLCIASSILLITYSSVGSPIQGLSEFKMKLKSTILTLLEELHTNEQEKLNETVKNISLQVAIEVDQVLQEHKFPTLSEELKNILTSQIEEVSKEDNKIRNLVEMRCEEFMEQVLTSSTASPIKIPPGLSSFQPELANLSGQLLRLVSHNRAVFGEYYDEIISRIEEKNSNA